MSQKSKPIKVKINGYKGEIPTSKGATGVKFYRVERQIKKPEQVFTYKDNFERLDNKGITPNPTAEGSLNSVFRDKDGRNNTIYAAKTALGALNYQLESFHPQPGLKYRLYELTPGKDQRFVDPEEILKSGDRDTKNLYHLHAGTFSGVGPVQGYLKNRSYYDAEIPAESREVMFEGGFPLENMKLIYEGDYDDLVAKNKKRHEEKRRRLPFFKEISPYYMHPQNLKESLADSPELFKKATGFEKKVKEAKTAEQMKAALRDPYLEGLFSMYREGGSARPRPIEKPLQPPAGFLGRAGDKLVPLPELRPEDDPEDDRYELPLPPDPPAGGK